MLTGRKYVAIRTSRRGGGEECKLTDAFAPGEVSVANVQGSGGTS